MVLTTHTHTNTQVSYILWIRHTSKTQWSRNSENQRIEKDIPNPPLKKAGILILVSYKENLKVKEWKKIFLTKWKLVHLD